MRTSSVCLALILCAASSCHDDAASAPGQVGAFFPGPDGAPLPPSSTIPYRSGGQFTVGARVHVENLRQPTRALVEIINPAPPAGTTLSATATLTDQGNFDFSGTTQLTWSRGGPVRLRISALGNSIEAVAQLDLPALAFDLGDASDNGASQSVPFCVSSTLADGTISLRLEQASIAGSGATDATAPLIPGACLGVTSPLVGASTHASWTVVPQGSSFRATAFVQNTAIALQKDLPVPARLPLTLTLSSLSGDSPAKLSIVEVAAHVQLGGIDSAGVAVTFQGTSDVVLTPAQVSTDSSGTAVTRFQMPEAGAVHIDAVAGKVRKGIDFQ